MKFAKEKKIIKARHCGESACEDWIKDKTGGVKSLNRPFSQKTADGHCVHCGKDAVYEIYFAKSY